MPAVKHPQRAAAKYSTGFGNLSVPPSTSGSSTISLKTLSGDEIFLPFECISEIVTSALVPFCHWDFALNVTLAMSLFSLIPFRRAEILSRSTPFIDALITLGFGLLDY